MNALKPEEAAYVAGIIDGEGHIAITRDKARNGFQLRIQVRTTSRALSEWLSETTGCGSTREMSDKRGNRMPCHEWRVFTNQALRILELIQPYIVMKRELVAIAIEFQRLPAPVRREQGLVYWNALQSLNLREMGRFARESAGG
jgi:hypothetical protein